MPLHIALAGGTGPLGLTILDELLRQKDGHNIIILSRSVPPTSPPVPTVQVDYTSPSSLLDTLTTHKIHTVISTLDTNRSGSAAELALIAAADACPFTKRYIPSIWGFPVGERVLGYLGGVRAKIEVEEAVERAGLEAGVVYTGFFADYYLNPSQVPSYFPPWPLMIDIPNNTALLPGEGTTPMVLTHTTDIAKYVVAMLDLPKWEKAAYIIGSRVTLKEFVEIAQEVKGVKFDIKYNATAEDWPEAYRMFAGLGNLIEEGWLNMGNEEGAWILNDIFPDTKAKGVRELLEASWGNK